jgi:hypothetical protein
MKGSFSESLNEYESAYKTSNDPLVLGFMGHAYAHLNRRAEGLKILDKMKDLAKQQYVDPYAFVIVYEALGDNEQAFQWVEKMYQTKSPKMALLKVDPILDPLRSDPRFADYVKRVGLAN